MLCATNTLSLTDMNKPKLILASASPRRREILQTLGLDFVCEATEADETLTGKYSPQQAVCELSRRKAEACLEKHKTEDVVIISADTVVALNESIIGKPKDKADAFDILSRLSGNTHSVFTGFTICTNSKSFTDFDKTDVFFHKLSEKQIREYISTGEPMDKAGAYGIQGKACVFVEKISGNYHNVVGFPISKICISLRDLFDINILC